MQEDYRNCRLCPRSCGVDRTSGGTGYCGMEDKLVVARAALHYWEEPCMSGEAGSGTVFFSGCGLRCVYCQNYGIAQAKRGKEIPAERLAEIFLELQHKGAWNINLVTAGHFLPHVLQALDLAKRGGLNLPVVYNSSGYECVDSLRRLDGYVDIYLPDMKYWSPAVAGKYSNAPDYFETASAALAEMVGQIENKGKQPLLEEGGRMLRGVIVRHLALPGQEEDSKHQDKRMNKILHENQTTKQVNFVQTAPFLSAQQSVLRRKGIQANKITCFVV